MVRFNYGMLESAYYSMWGRDSGVKLVACMVILKFLPTESCVILWYSIEKLGSEP